MWMVFDSDEGLVGVYDNYTEAHTVYCKHVDGQQEASSCDNGFVSGEERVILSKVYKQLYPSDTGEPVLEEDEEGNEFATKDTYWELKEEIYDLRK